MRLLHVYGGNLYGGVERLLVSLAEFAARAPGLEQTFALCYSGRLSRELLAVPARLHELGGVRASRPWQVRAGRRHLRGWLRTQPDFDVALCHAWWSYAIFGPALRAAGIPVALWAHDPASGRGWLERWAGRRRPALLITHGEYMIATMDRLFPGLAAHAIHAPVALAPAPDGAAAAALRRALDTPAEALVILQASRLEPWKGHARLLQALAQLRDLPQWVAWIAGGAQRPHERAYLAELRGQARRLGIADRVRWLGERNDVTALMQAADIFCQPNSSPEPFGIVFLEALAAGLPVVAAASGGALEIVTPACGRLAGDGAPAVAEALRSLLLDPALRAQLARQAPQRARELADPATQMRLFCSTLEGVVQ